MTPIESMTPEERNREIAEACGYRLETRAHIYPFRVVSPDGTPGPCWWGTQAGAWSHALPGYCSDLNAVALAEKQCLETDEQISAYLDALTDEAGGDTPVGTASFTAYFATAQQRSNALLRVLRAHATEGL